MKKQDWLKYLIYLVRWQLSTPILSIVLILLDKVPTIWATVVANLIGGLIFFWVDKLIFNRPQKNNKKEEQTNMCIYKVYKSRQEIISDYNEEKLEDGYIIAYDRRLYKIEINETNFMHMITNFVFNNEWEYNHIKKMCNLEFYNCDTVTINNKTATE